MWHCGMFFINIQSYCLLSQSRLRTGGARPFQENTVPGPRDRKIQLVFCLIKQIQVRAGLSYSLLKDVWFVWDGKINQKQGSIRQGFGIHKTTGFVLYIVCWHTRIFKRNCEDHYTILISLIETVKDFM